MPSWDELVRQHADRVYRLAYRLSGNQHDAEDLTQETFIRVFRSVQNYQPGTFEGWLHRITTNLFLDMVRRRGRIRMEALPEDYDRVPADEPNPEQIFHDSRLGPDLQAALDSLPPEFRAAVGRAPNSLATVPDARIPGSLQEAQAIARREHPAILQAQHSISVAELNIAAAEAAKRPTLSLGSSISIDNEFEDTESIGLNLLMRCQRPDPDLDVPLDQPRFMGPGKRACMGKAVIIQHIVQVRVRIQL